jgi:hypothetical protein
VGDRRLAAPSGDGGAIGHASGRAASASSESAFGARASESHPSLHAPTSIHTMPSKRARTGDELADEFAVEAPVSSGGADLIDGSVDDVDAAPAAEQSKRQRRKVRARERAAAEAAVAAVSGAAAAVSASGSAPASARSLPGPRSATRGAPQPHARMPVEAQASLLWALFRASAAGAPLTPLEFVAPLSADGIAACDDGAAAITGVASLTPLVKRALPGWGRIVGSRSAAVPRRAGAPSVLVITHSAGRAMDLLRALSPFGARVSKLFAKHFSVAEAAAALRVDSPPAPFAVGTPHRVRALLDDGALSVDALALVVLDNEEDAKTMHVLTEKTASEELWSLYSAHLHASVRQGKTKLALLR